MNNACVVIGTRVDPRTNYLVVAGCVAGNAYVHDADSGALVMEYQLTSGDSLINDLTIPRDADAATAIPLSGDFENGDAPCRAANGIVATPDGKTLIIGRADEISVDVPQDGFLDGVASGVIFGYSLYVNNARYSQYPREPTTRFWITKLQRRP
jgi:hypothetical protein